MLANRSKNQLRLFFLCSLGLFLVVAIGLPVLAKWKVAQVLAQRIPNNLNLEYTDLQVNPFFGNVQIENVSLTLLGQDRAIPQGEIVAELLRVEGFSIWQFLYKNVIDIDLVLMKDSMASKYRNDTLDQKDTVYQESAKMSMPFLIGEIKIENGAIMINQGSDRIFLTAQGINLSLSHFKLDSNSMRDDMPFAYNAIALSGEDLFVDLSPFESLAVESIELKNEILRINELTVQSKYSRRELSLILEEERAHIDLIVPEIMLDKFDFGFANQSFFVVADLCRLELPDLVLYRDKLIADNTRKKPLYSRMLRELPLDITISSVEMNEGHVTYEGRGAANIKPGRLSFQNINARCTNLSNTYASGQRTTINADGLFMENASVSLDWDFDVNSIEDAFTAAGTIIDLDAETINPFLESNMRSRAEGHVDELYFTVSGNSESSAGEMKMKYTDFKFSILKKSGLGINKLLTTIGNSLVKNGSRTDENGYRYGKIKVQRDPAKSFFYFLGANIRNGLRHTMTGSGKRETRSNSSH